MSKFCVKCGNEMEVGASICTKCGTIKSGGQMNSSSKISNNNQSSTDYFSANTINNMQASSFKSENIFVKTVNELKTNPQKRKKSIVIASIALVFIIMLSVVLGVVINASRYTEIDIKQLYTFKATGLNGKGNLTSATNGEYSLAKFYEAVDIDVNKTKKSGDFDLENFSTKNMQSLFNEKELIKVEVLNKALSSVKQENSNESNLSNGDEVKIKFTYNNELMKKAYIKIKNNEFVYKVEGLKEGITLDLFANLKINYKGISPNITVEIDKSSCDQFVQEEVNFKLDKSSKFKNGDKITITASYSDFEAENMGYIINEKKKEYTVSGDIDYISTTDGLDLAIIEKEINDKLTSHLTNYSDVTTGSLKSKHFLKTKEQYVSFGSANNRIIYLYEYQTTSSHSPIKAFSVTVENITKDKNNVLKWNASIDVNSASSLDELTKSTVTSQVDKYIVSPIQ